MHWVPGRLSSWLLGTQAWDVSRLGGLHIRGGSGPAGPAEAVCSATLLVLEEDSRQKGRGQSWGRGEGVGSLLWSWDPAGPSVATGVPPEHGVMALPAEAWAHCPAR